MSNQIDELLQQGVARGENHGDPKILIVDDEPNNLRVLSESLQAEYDLIVASSAEEALQILEQGEIPDLILLDIMMPGLNGFELCQNIKSNNRLKRIPIIFITALTDTQSEQQGFELGAVDYVHKPFRLPILKARVKTHLSLSGQLDHILTLAKELNARIAELDSTENTLTESQPIEELFHRVFMSTSEGIMVTDAEGNIQAVNHAFSRITGYEESEVKTQNLRLLASEANDDSFFDVLWKRLKSEGFWSGELYGRRKNGESYSELRTMSAVHNESGEATHFVVVFNDITSLKQTQERLDYLTWHDHLTGLPNRLLLLDRVETTLSLCRRRGKITSLLVLDINQFKVINETQGVAFADQILSEFARRIQGVLAEGDTLARLGSDEFAILLTPVSFDIDTASQQAIEMAQSLHEGIKQPFHAPTAKGTEHLSLSCSIGIALFPSDNCRSAAGALQHADTALHQAKQRDSETLFFEDAMGRSAKARFELELELTTAIETDQLKLYVQPQIDASGNTSGLEALVRWQHPDKGLIPPGDFIPIAEKSQLICRIGSWVMGQALSLLEQLEQKGIFVPVSINISPRHFSEPDFVDETLQLLQQSQADANLVTLEVTESLMIHDIEAVIKKMKQLTDAGFSFSIDDFGTGYSSLSYLRRLPISELKIDREFVRNAPDDPMDAEIVAMINNLGEFMGLRMVAEGVETERHANLLSARFPRIHHQGYYHSRPIPIDTWLGLLPSKEEGQ